jgi:hypothetical protein
MKILGFRAAFGAAFFMAAPVGTGLAATVECSGPFKQCAITVGAFCEIENGKMMIWYKDVEGASNRFEQCIGKIYEEHGKPNPYRPSSSQKPAPKR